MKIAVIFWIFATIIGLLNCLLSLIEGDYTSIVLSITNLAGIVCFLIYYRDKSKTANWMTAGLIFFSTGAAYSLITVFNK